VREIVIRVKRWSLRWSYIDAKHQSISDTLHAGHRKESSTTVGLEVTAIITGKLTNVVR